MSSNTIRFMGPFVLLALVGWTGQLWHGYQMTQSRKQHHSDQSAWRVTSKHRHNNFNFVSGTLLDRPIRILTHIAVWSE